MVDTPGFDDDDQTDSEVLKKLVDWLVSTYRSGQRLNGILYLHRITDTRMRGSSLRNLKMFKELIGDEFYENLTLGTTCWSLIDSKSALERENELKTESKFWEIMISKGARLERIPDDDVIKARDLVYKIASRDTAPLQTQRDVVERGISFSDLAVTQTVNYKLEQISNQQRAEIENVEEENQTQRRQDEDKKQRELASVREENDQRIAEIKRQVYICTTSNDNDCTIL